MKNSKNTINSKINYNTSNNYQKHFDLNDRITIKKIITENRDDNGELTIMLKDIGNMMKKDPSSISKEVKHRRILKERTSDKRFKIYNSICENYKTCKITIGDIYHPYNCLKNCSKCVDDCKDFKEIVCQQLAHFPWVCNGCKKSQYCHLNKYFYYSDVSQKDYKQTLTESRKGINLTEDEFKNVDHIVSTQVKNGQPIYHIINSYELPVSSRTIYNYFENGYFEAKNIDLRRKVSYKKRYKHTPIKEFSKKIKEGRMYEDYTKYMETHPDASVVEMDTVISADGSKKALLTLYFVKFHFQLAYLLPSKEAINITSVINMICDEIGIDNFKKLFEVILTDNGVEFSNPNAIEIEPTSGLKRTNVFYCHPYCSCEKGHCEKNHEYIRYILPKGTIFESLTQELCDLMMSHINSTKRPSVNGTPYEYMALTYGTEILDKLKIKKIDPFEVTLKPSLLK